MENWNDIIVLPSVSLLEVLKILELKGTQFVLVVDANGYALGTITDGDVRRGLMKNISLQSECSTVMNPNFYYLKPGAIKAHEIEEINKRKIKFVPIVNGDGKFIEIRSFDSLNCTQVRENEVLILAGGLGSRLGDLTKTCPKPLLKVGNTPILENILISLKSSGLKKINISVNYLSNMIEDYFEDGKKWGVEINYVREGKRLGTAGPLSLMHMGRLDQPLLVLNGDLITKVDFGALLDFHNDHSNIATMCVRQHEIKIPYGVVEYKGATLQRLVEKPVKYFQVNAGIYAFSPEITSLVPADSYFDMNNLFETCLDVNKSVGIFPIHEYWVDIGRPDDLSKVRAEQ